MKTLLLLLSILSTQSLFADTTTLNTQIRGKNILKSFLSNSNPQKKSLKTSCDNQNRVQEIPLSRETRTARLARVARPNRMEEFRQTRTIRLARINCLNKNNIHLLKDTKYYQQNKLVIGQN